MYHIIFAILLALLGVDKLHAQQDSQSSVKVGESDLYPSVRIDYESLSNIFRNSENEVDATGVRVAPSAILVANKKGVEIKTGYEGAYAVYSEDELDFDDHHVFGSIDAVLGTRQRLSGLAYLNLSHQELGTLLTLGDATFGSEQIEITDFGVDSSYTFGAPTARINLTGGLNLQSRTYQNRQDVTDGRDYFELDPFGRLSFRLSSDTRALLELGVRSLSFDDSIFDRNELRLLAGLSFRGTGKTGGSAKIGVVSSTYSEDGFSDRTTLAADIGLYFLPSSLSRIDLNVGRQFNDEDTVDISSGVRQTIADSASLRWRKQWSGFVASTAFLGLQNLNRDCPVSSTQSVNARFDVSVKPRRWFEVGAGFSNTNRTADSCDGVDTNDLEFDAQKVFIFLNISL